HQTGKHVHRHASVGALRPGRQARDLRRHVGRRGDGPVRVEHRDGELLLPHDDVEVDVDVAAQTTANLPGGVACDARVQGGVQLQTGGDTGHAVQHEPALDTEGRFGLQFRGERRRVRVGVVRQDVDGVPAAAGGVLDADLEVEALLDVELHREFHLARGGELHHDLGHEHQDRGGDRWERDAGELHTLVELQRGRSHQVEVRFLVQHELRQEVGLRAEEAGTIEVDDDPRRHEQVPGYHHLVVGRAVVAVVVVEHAIEVDVDG